MSDSDPYDNPYHLSAIWSRDLDGEDDGFPTRALDLPQRSGVQLLVLGFLADDGFDRFFYERLKAWWADNWSRHSIQKPTFGDKWLHSVPVRAYLKAQEPYIYRDKTGIHKHSFRDYVIHYRDNWASYTIENTEVREKRPCVFTYPDKKPKKVIQVPVMKISLVPVKKKPIVKHEPVVEFTPEQQVLAVKADLDGDGVITTTEIERIDKDGDKCVTREEVEAVRAELAPPEPEPEPDPEPEPEPELANQPDNTIVEKFCREEVGLEALVEVPEDTSVPTPQTVIQDPSYRPEESFQVNFIAYMLDELNNDPNIDVQEFVVRAMGVLVQNWKDLTLNVVVEAAKMILARLTRTGQLRLSKDTYVGTDKAFTEEEFATVEAAIDDREATFEHQAAILADINSLLETVDTQQHLILLANHPRVQSFDRRLHHVENTYVRL